MQEENKEIDNGVKIIDIDTEAKDGQEKCPKCGSTDIELNIKTGKLRCNFCRYEYEAEKAEDDEDLSKLEGIVIGSGAMGISADAEDQITLKCSSCGAEVVVDTSSSTQARCHWCRNMLSINQQVPNGSVPDIVLPFKIEKQDAEKEIASFVKKRKFFANTQFKKEFTTENIMGVYFPYMVVDVNSHARFEGQGEIQTRRYTLGSGDDAETYYDADAYSVVREFDLAIDNLTIESSKDRLNSLAKDKTNNVINAIMPFDIENCVKYNSNYLHGYTSEKRDANVEELEQIVKVQAKDIARFACNDTLKLYDRGVAWNKQELEVKGQKWISAYLPVWLYSYQQVKGKKKVLHYVAVNARTSETMGSVPLNKVRLWGMTILVELLGFVAMVSSNDFDFNWIFLLSGVIFYVVIYLRYRNSDARHEYERETKKQISKLEKKDVFLGNRKKLRYPWIEGRNNNVINGINVGNSVADKLMREGGTISEIVNNFSKNK